MSSTPPQELETLLTSQEADPASDPGLLVTGLGLADLGPGAHIEIYGDEPHSGANCSEGADDSWVFDEAPDEVPAAADTTLTGDPARPSPQHRRHLLPVVAGLGLLTAAGTAVALTLVALRLGTSASISQHAAATLDNPPPTAVAPPPFVPGPWVGPPASAAMDPAFADTTTAASRPHPRRRARARRTDPRPATAPAPLSRLRTPTPIAVAPSSYALPAVESAVFPADEADAAPSRGLLRKRKKQK